MANIDGNDQFIDGSKTSIAIGPPPGTVPTYVSRTRLTRYTNLADGSNVTGDKAAVTEVVYTKPGASSQPPQSSDFTPVETRGDKQIVRHKDGRIARLNGDKLEWLLYQPTDTRTNGGREYGAAFWAADPSFNTVAAPAEVAPPPRMPATPAPEVPKVEGNPESEKKSDVKLPEKSEKPGAGKTEGDGKPSLELNALKKVRQDELNKKAVETVDAGINGGNLVAPSAVQSPYSGKYVYNGILLQERTEKFLKHIDEANWIGFGSYSRTKSPDPRNSGDIFEIPVRFGPDRTNGSRTYYVAARLSESGKDGRGKWELYWSWKKDSGWTRIDGGGWLPALDQKDARLASTEQVNYWNARSSDLMGELIKIQRGDRRD